MSTYKKDNRLHSLKVWMSPQSIISVITFLVKKDKFFKVVNRTFDPTGSLKQNWPFFRFFFFKFLVLWCKHMYCWNALKWILKLKGRDIHLHIFCKMCFFFQKYQKWTVYPCTNFYQYYVICKEEVLWEVYYICFFAEKMNRAISITGCLWSNIA